MIAIFVAISVLYQPRPLGRPLRRLVRLDRRSCQQCGYEFEEIRESATAELLPLDRAGRLRGDVEGDAVDAADLVDDAVGGSLEQVVGRRAQSAVIASSEVTARITIG